MAVVGTIVAESLRTGGAIELGLTLRRVSRIPVTATDGQPIIWTLIDFRCDKLDVDVLASQLADALDIGPWYADFSDDQHKYVVYTGRIFRFARDDADARKHAVEYGLSIGVPAEQLDWPL